MSRFRRIPKDHTSYITTADGTMLNLYEKHSASDLLKAP